MKKEKPLSLSEAAIYLDLTELGVLELVKEGKLLARRSVIGKARYFFYLSELRKYQIQKSNHQ